MQLTADVAMATTPAYDRDRAAGKRKKKKAAGRSAVQALAGRRLMRRMKRRAK